MIARNIWQLFTRITNSDIKYQKIKKLPAQQLAIFYITKNKEVILMTVNLKYELPLTLTVDQVAELLGICRKGAYSLVKDEGLAIRVGYRRLIVPSDRLIDYLTRNENIFAE